MRLCLCLCASENSIRQISGFVLLMFLLMLTLMSRVFSLVMLMLCLCASENQPLPVNRKMVHVRPTVGRQTTDDIFWELFFAVTTCAPFNFLLASGESCVESRIMS